jgi:hypothetical protein
VLNAPLPAQLEADIREAYAELERRTGVKDVPVAVRSSGESEDWRVRASPDSTTRSCGCVASSPSCTTSVSAGWECSARQCCRTAWMDRLSSPVATSACASAFNKWSKPVLLG